MELPSSLRVRRVNAAPVRPDGTFVLYWMIAARRAVLNFALDRAVDWAQSLHRPLVVFEGLRSDYPWASDRLHRFVMDGMQDNAAALARTPALYLPYLERAHHESRGLLPSLARQACVVVTDEFPCFFLPRMVERAGQALPIRLEAVDSNGILPMRATDRAYPAAVHFRRHLQKQLRSHLSEFPREEPFRDRAIPPATENLITSALGPNWLPASKAALDGASDALRRLPIDHRVGALSVRGGSRAAEAALTRFVSSRLEFYHDAHNHPDDDGTSRFSPYLHFGHLSVHAVFNAVMRRESWSVGKLGTASGAREGWWGVRSGAEAFLDQLLVWRELAFNTCVMRPDDYDRFGSLPKWALATLEAHRGDHRRFVYTRQQFEDADTHDPLWNAAQRQLREEGWCHNYLRMLWGKKILEWSASPEEALDTMRTVMDRWSLDGRDPNSYAGYFWTLGRYDRPWPERPIYGTVRSMSSESARKKIRVAALLAKYGTGLTGGGPVQGDLLSS